MAHAGKVNKCSELSLDELTVAAVIQEQVWWGADTGGSGGPWEDGSRLEPTALPTAARTKEISSYAFSWDLVNQKDSSKALISINSGLPFARGPPTYQVLCSTHIAFSIFPVTGKWNSQSTKEETET